MARREKRQREAIHNNDSEEEDYSYNKDVGVANFTLSQQDPEPSQSIPTERPNERTNL
jgi:hypothetical protein